MSQQLSDRQQQIIDVSLELISENGIQGLTIKNLAKKIGFSESAIYRHYENKIEILVAILNYFKENTEHIFVTELKSDEDTITKIQNLFINQFRIFTKSPSFLAVIFSEELFRNETILSERVAEIMNNNLDTLTQIIRIGQNKGELRNDIEASHLALVVMGALRLFVKKWQISNHSFDLRKEGLKITQSISVIIKN
ncbi:TetR/AcrR family transcriptional regulator [uncultured Draconibacterium sp.]|uniref:TetR/AcrR family transcriptional regulator n=1 Tax=uncultured Draconibacterium sp. TaxID=1573823 RepID=UPI0025EE8DD5|nr:TetR/AcrR family transcriptional regulator [uncultured Draconibacterium sp.]